MWPTDSFVARLSQWPSARIAVHDKDRGWINYGTLATDVAAAAAMYGPGTARLAFIFPRTDYRDIVRYLALLKGNFAVAPFDRELSSEFIGALINAYKPDLIFGLSFKPADYEVVTDDHMRRTRSVTPAIRDGTGLLLSTSGSTGSPKLARLSVEAIAHNANAIAEVLELRADDRALLHLPLFYAFGLSVLHSHLAVGAGVIPVDDPVMSTAFWERARDAEATLLPGTPFHFEVVLRLGLDRLGVNSLRTGLQAGGKMPKSNLAALHQAFAARKARFFVAYGQTEAGPRMTTLPSSFLPAKMGSVGIPLPGGSIAILDANGQAAPAGTTGEIVYRGVNVMWGYAHTRDDLAKGDENGGVLHTGDLGYLDAAGFLFVTGRTKRFAKVGGHRINLDEVEALVAEEAAAVDAADCIRVYIVDRGQNAKGIRDKLAADLRLNSSTIQVTMIGQMPRTTRGKIDYSKLRSLT